MPDIWSNVRDLDEATQGRLAVVLEARGEDRQQQAMRQAFLREVTLPPHAHVLDVGCGTGVFTRVLAQWPNVASVIGIDSAPTLLAKARDAAVGLPNLSFRAGDGRALPFDADSFDLITFDSVFSHLSGPKQALEEAFRVLRAGASLAIFDGDYATATVALGDHDPLQVCVEAMMAGSVTDRHIMRRLPNVVVACGFELRSFVSYGFAEVGNDGYMLTVVDRGADTLYNQGCIGEETASVLKNEARRRLSSRQFFGHIAYAGLIARKPVPEPS